jgi:hypothetical protein
MRTTGLRRAFNSQRPGRVWRRVPASPLALAIVRALATDLESAIDLEWATVQALEIGRVSGVDLAVAIGPVLAIDRALSTAPATGLGLAIVRVPIPVPA